MNWIIQYILSFVLILFAIISGYVLKIKAQKVFSETEAVGSEKEITGEILTKTLAKNNNLNTTIAKINTNKTNYYSFKYNVIKLSSNTLYSYEFSQLAICAFCTKQALFAKNNGFLYVVNIALNFLAKLLTIIFIPTLLVCSILNISFNLNKISFLILTISAVCFAVCIVFELIKLLFQLISTKKFISNIKKTNFFSEKELNILKNQMQAIYKLSYADFTTYSLSFFKLLNPDILFNVKSNSDEQN